MGRGKGQVLNAAFLLLLASKTCLQQSQVSETSGKIWSSGDLPLVEEDQAREHLDRLDVYKSMGLDGILP